MARSSLNASCDVVQSRLNRAALERWQRRSKAISVLSEHIARLEFAAGCTGTHAQRAAEQLVSIRRLAAEYGVVLS